MFEIQFSTKSLKKEHSTVVGQGGVLEEKIDISDTLSHLINMHPVGAFLAEHFDKLNYNSFSSEILIFSSLLKFILFVLVFQSCSYCNTLLLQVLHIFQCVDYS